MGRPMPADKRAPKTAMGPKLAARLARRDRRRDRSREEILAAARAVLLRNGVAAMTLDAVAREVGVSKTALYYYFPSKDALLFELMYSALETHARAVHDAVEETKDGVGALSALIRQSVKTFGLRLEDFRLAFLQSQLATPGSVRFDAEQFARIRPLNDLLLAGAAKKLTQGVSKRGNHAKVEPRLLAFLAYLAALGLLTMKGLVESMNDPLKYSDDQMIEALARVFAAAAAPD
jgi:AcrR family transcriptional regulator